MKNEISASELSAMREKQMVAEAVRLKAWPTDKIEMTADKEAIREQLKQARRNRTTRVKSIMP